jgi:hypothetical protein
VARLTSRNLHLLALRISTYLSLKPDVVLKHWASAKIMRSKASATDGDVDGDDEVCKMIVDKFEQLGGEGVSYADIAKRAWEVGRAGLATKVSDFNVKRKIRQQMFPISAFGSRVKDLRPGTAVVDDEGRSAGIDESGR